MVLQWLIDQLQVRLFRLTIILKIRFYSFKVVPGPEADLLMKSWVVERDEER
jgi:hypothetical protein